MYRFKLGYGLLIAVFSVAVTSCSDNREPAASNSAAHAAHAAAEPVSEEPSLFSHGARIFEHTDLLSAKDRITTYYSSETYQDQAIRLRTLIQDAISFYKDKLGVEHSIDVAVLDESDWAKYVGDRGAPYGLPFIAGSGNSQIAIMPATADGVITQGAIALRKYASEETLAKLPLTNRTFEDGAFAFTDSIAVHELGHALTEAYGIEPVSLWSTEFLATYFSYAFLREKHPDLATVFELYAHDLNNDSPGPQPDKSLARLEEYYVSVGPDDYAWYQGMFLGLAMKVYDEQGLELFPAMKAQFPVTGENQPQGEAIDLAQEFDIFDKISPIVKQWRKESFQ